jgi:glutaredoxin
MTQKATFYHAGCPICADAERQIATALDPARFTVEIVHLGTDRGRISEAEAAGVASVPALVISGMPLHINFGASLADVKGTA